MIQNIYPKKYDNRYLKKNPQRSDFAMIFDNNKILLKNGADGLSSVSYTHLTLPTICSV